MITGFLLSAVYAILIGLTQFLPTGTGFPSYIISAATSLGGMLYAWNLILPITELMTTIGLTITLLLGIFAVRSIFYVVALFRGNSMPGNI